MLPLLEIVVIALRYYMYVILIMAIFSWLLSFNVINFHNQIVRNVWRFLVAVTDPVLQPIRRIVPNLGGVDISPLILYFIVYFIIREIELYAIGYVP